MDAVGTDPPRAVPLRQRLRATTQSACGETEWPIPVIPSRLRLMNVVCATLIQYTVNGRHHAAVVRATAPARTDESGAK